MRLTDRPHAAQRLGRVRVSSRFAFRASLARTSPSPLPSVSVPRTEGSIGSGIENSCCRELHAFSFGGRTPALTESNERPRHRVSARQRPLASPDQVVHPGEPAVRQQRLEGHPGARDSRRDLSEKPDPAIRLVAFSGDEAYRGFAGASFSRSCGRLRTRVRFPPPSMKLLLMRAPARMPGERFTGAREWPRASRTRLQTPRQPNGRSDASSSRDRSGRAPVMRPRGAVGV